MKTTEILFGILTSLALAGQVQAQTSVTNYFSTTNATQWQIAGGGVTNATAYESTAYAGSLTVISGGDTGTYVTGMTNFTGFWLADYVFYLPYGVTSISLSYSYFYVDDRGILLLNGNPIVATGIPYLGNLNPGSLVITDGGLPQPYSSFVGPDGSLSGTVTNGFNVGGYNTLRAIINNTRFGVYGPDVPVSSGDGTYLHLLGAVSYTLGPTVNLIKAVKPSFSNLTVGSTYLLQSSSDLSTWYDQGPPFTATSTQMDYPEYYDVDFWNQLYFRLQVAP
jgi:hypothetical protein